MRTGKITFIPVITSFPSLWGAPLRVPSLWPANQRPAPAADAPAMASGHRRCLLGCGFTASAIRHAGRADSSARAEFAARQLRKVHLRNECNHFMVVGAPSRADRSDAR